MKTDFFWKNILRSICCFVMIFICACLIFENLVVNRTVIEIQNEFHFLASTSTHIEASTHSAQQLGGAGFPLEYKDRKYVTYAVYTDSAMAERAYQALKQREENICVLTVQAKNPKIDRKEAIAYKNAMDCLYAQIRLFNAEIARLEDGATQESTKRFLNIQQRQFSYMATQYDKNFSKFSSICQQAVAQIESMKNQTVYAKDMRYFECFLCDVYVKLGNNFSA